MIIKSYIFIIIIYLFFITDTFSQSGWINTYIGTSENIGVFFYITYTGYIIRNDGFVLKSINSGNNWVAINTTATNAIVGSFTNSILGVIWSIPPKLTTDGGVEWNTISNNFFSLGMGYITGITFINNSVGFAIGGDLYPLPNPCCYDGIINKTTNAGQNWNEIYRLTGLELQDIKFNDENNLIILDKGGLVISTDGGNSWITSNNIFEDVRFFRANSMSDPFKDTIYVAGKKTGNGLDTGVIIKSTSGGNSWFVSLQLSFDSNLRELFFLDNNIGYAVGDTGLIVKTTNGGDNWEIQNSGTRKQLNGVSFLNKDTGFVVGDSGLILETTTGGIVTKVININSEIPDKYFLSQNYPNPFNPNTIINYQCSMFNFVSLKVYDVLGNEVKTLVNEKKNAGSYSVSFDGSNLPSGIYFYKLEAGNFSEVKKMTLLK